MQLPATIKETIDELMEGQSTQELAKEYQAVSDRYRREIKAASLQITSPAEALAYVAARLPATYGAVGHVCSQLAEAIPDFTPRTLLDIGAGPGTAALAAITHWQESLTSAKLIEPNVYLQDVSRPLLGKMPVTVTFERNTLAQAQLSEPCDLVLASYVLNEIPDLTLDHEITRLWNVTSGTLILIEPGTPLGFEIILKARAHLLSLGAYLAAPCPHSATCPLASAERWCHISARIERSSLHRKIKDNASLGYEDEKFSYLVATRLPPHLPPARLLGHPHGQKIIELELCRADGSFGSTRLSKRDPAYKSAKKLKWGDSL